MENIPQYQVRIQEQSRKERHRVYSVAKESKDVRIAYANAFLDGILVMCRKTGVQIKFEFPTSGTTLCCVKQGENVTIGFSTVSKEDKKMGRYSVSIGQAIAASRALRIVLPTQLYAID